MPIQSSNLKFYLSSVRNRSPLNGGMPSSVEIVDGASNQIFPDVSETARAGGDVEFAKIYPAVRTADTSALLGANLVVSEPPADAATSIMMLRAASVTETQSDLIARLGGVSGALTATQRSSINDGAYLFAYIPPGSSYSIRWEFAGTFVDASGPLIGSPPVAGSNGAFCFIVNSNVFGVALTRFISGVTLTMVDFYNSTAVQVETFTIARAVKAGSGGAGVYALFLEFSAASAYSSWGLADSFWANGASEFGAYFIESNIASGLSKASFFGASRLTSSASPASRVLNVAATRAGVIPSALATSPEAETVLGFKPGLLSKSIDGKEPIFEVGRYVVLGKDIVDGPTSYSPSVITLGEALLKRVKIVGYNGQPITSGWTADLDTGTVTITSVSGWSLPARIVARAEDMAMITAMSSGTLTLGRDLTRSYPTGSAVSAAMVLQDIYAKTTALFDQQTWTGVWQDSVAGSAAGAEYNAAVYPLQVTNEHAITERWRITFTSTLAFTVIGEHVGQIAAGDTTTDCAPINPATGGPYFTLRALGWGGGWSAGNVLRINTDGAAPPVWLLRCIQQSADTLASEQFEIALRGGVDRP